MIALATVAALGALTPTAADARGGFGGGFHGGGFGGGFRGGGLAGGGFRGGSLAARPVGGGAMSRGGGVGFGRPNPAGFRAAPQIYGGTHFAGRSLGGS